MPDSLARLQAHSDAATRKLHTWKLDVHQPVCGTLCCKYMLVAVLVENASISSLLGGSPFSRTCAAVTSVAQSYTATISSLVPQRSGRQGSGSIRRTVSDKVAKRGLYLSKKDPASASSVWCSMLETPFFFQAADVSQAVMSEVWVPMPRSGTIQNERQAPRWRRPVGKWVVRRAASANVAMITPLVCASGARDTRAWVIDEAQTNQRVSVFAPGTSRVQSRRRVTP